MGAAWLALGGCLWKPRKALAGGDEVRPHILGYAKGRFARLSRVHRPALPFGDDWHGLELIAQLAVLGSPGLGIHGSVNDLSAVRERSGCEGMGQGGDHGLDGS